MYGRASNPPLHMIIKEFNVTLPQKITLDDDFIYFFGLWCGDRAGGKRLGVCNQNREVLEFVEIFLKKLL